MTQSDLDKVWLTQEAYDRLKSELDDLKGPQRQEIVERISAARDEGDLKENGGYHAAKEEQGKLEMRIAQVEDLLRRAEIGDTPPDDGVVEQGMKVTVRFPAFDETEIFLFGSKELEDGGQLAVYSPQSAMGKAIDGKKKGDLVTYKAPTGKEIQVEIIDAVPYSS